MIRRLLLAAVVAPAALHAAVQDAPPPPLPSADGAAPAAEPNLTPVTRTRRAAAPAEEARSAFGGSVSISGGYDSNVLLIDDQDAQALDTGQDGAAIDVDAKLLWRAVDRPEARLNVIGDAGFDDYPGHSERRLWRYGGLVTGLAKWRGWDPGVALGFHQFVLDGDRVADVLNGSLSLSRIARDWVAIPSLEAYAVDYAGTDVDDASGVLAAARYRHWFLLAPGDSRKRIEVGVRVGWYDAQTAGWSYATVRPEAALSYRYGRARPARGTVDLAVRLFDDWRDYGTGGIDDIGNENLIELGGSADYWTCRWSSLGLYAAYTRRDADRRDRDYDRFQVGARLTAAW